MTQPDPLPGVSVIIVSCDRLESLRHTIFSLRYQRLKGFELIVVSNSGPDDLPDCPFPVRHLRFDERNISRARNLGMSAASGDVLVFLDDDAVPEFGWLEALVAPFKNPRIGSVAGYVRGRNGVSFQWQTVLVDRYGSDVLHVSADAPEVFPPGVETILKTTGCNAAFRRQAVASVGGFDEAYAFFLDEVDLNLRLNRAGWMSAVVPGAEVHHAYASGPHRNRHRTPTSLFELGASKAFFCQKHLAPTEIPRALSLFRRDQHRRLDRLFAFGLIDAEARQALESGLQDGFSVGRVRASTEPAVSRRSIQPLEPPWVEQAERHILTCSRLDERKARSEAARLAQTGAEVTLILLEPTIWHLSVRFEREGYWFHRLGLFGRDGRKSPWRPAGRATRLNRECARISNLRTPKAASA